MSHGQDHAEKRWYLVSYDIRDQKRWREAYKTLKGSGDRIQYSLFRCRLSKKEMERLRWELECILSRDDDLMFIYLCPGCAARILEKDKDSGWGKPVPRFEVL